MAQEKIVNLKVTDNIDETTSSVKSLRTQLREAQQDVAQLSDKFGATSKQAIEAAKRAAQLKDAIGDAKALTEAFNPDAKFKAVSSSLTGVAGGFSAITGAMGLFGEESKEVEKAILRVQSAMALASGLQAVGEARDSFKQLGAVAVNALKGIKNGIAATGIGLFLVALGAIVAYWDDIKEAVSGVTTEQRKLNEASKVSFDTKVKELETISAQDNVLKLQGKSEKEILAIKIKKTDEAIALGKVELLNIATTNKALKAAEERNFNYLKTFTKYAVEASILPLRILAAPIDLLIGTVNKVATTLGFSKVTAININDEISKLSDLGAAKLAGFVFDPVKVEANGNEVLKKQQDALLKIQNDRAGYILQGQAIDKAAADKAKAAQKEKDKEDARLREESLKAGDKLIQENYDYERKKNKVIEDERAKHLNNLVTTNLNARSKEISDNDAARQAELEAEKENTEAKKKIKEEEFAHNQLLLNATANGLEVVSDLIGKNTAAGKATAVAAALINTYAAIAGQLRAFAGVPIPGYAIVQAVATGLAGFAAVKNILKVQVPNGGGGGAAPAGAASGGISAATPPAPPQFNVVGTGGVNQVAQAFSNNQQQPIKAYVVSNDVTTAQSLDRNIVKSASLG
jgi:hypothetical protein